MNRKAPTQQLDGAETLFVRSRSCLSVEDRLAMLERDMFHSMRQQVESRKLSERPARRKEGAAC